MSFFFLFAVLVGDSTFPTISAFNLSTPFSMKLPAPLMTIVFQQSSIFYPKIMFCSTRSSEFLGSSVLNTRMDSFLNMLGTLSFPLYPWDLSFIRFSKILLMFYGKRFSYSKNPAFNIGGSYLSELGRSIFTSFSHGFSTTMDDSF